MTTSLSIIVVEDNDSLRKATVAMLVREGHQASGLVSAEEVDGVIHDIKPDIFVIDLNLPGEDGISLAKRLKTAMPLVGIIMVTARNRLDERLEGYENGADIYLTKPVAPSELLATVSSLGRRMKIEAPMQCATQNHHGAGIHPPQFSPREIEVLRLIASGLGYKEVAESMSISLSTVQTHIRSLYRKLDVNSQMQAVIRGKELGVLR